MARLILNKNVTLESIRRQLGKQFVIRQSRGQVIISAYPDMSNVKRSNNQKCENNKFAQAVAYAKFAKDDPVEHARLSVEKKEGQSVYHAAVSEFLKKSK
jgi:hypothetical protein